MATSRFTIYTSSDPQGPGGITGLSGSLLAILDACLVNGYGTGSFYKAPAGWSKPLMNYSNSVVYGPQLGCYKQGSGSMCTLFVNDAGPNVTSTTKEAWVCGFEQILSLTASAYPLGTIFTGSAGNGSGLGQFPRSDQLLTYGHAVWRKSSATDINGRAWILAADASTMYLWVKPADNGETYNWYAFGDLFSLAGPADKYRCVIIGRPIENTALGIANYQDWSAAQGTAASTINGGSAYGANWSGQPGHYIQRTAGGTSQSVPFCKYAGGLGPSQYASNPPMLSLAGIYPCPNGSDSSYILFPLQVIQSDVYQYRGRLRGLYVPLHSVGFFGDGQVISGGGDYAGKTFMIIRTDYNGVSMWALEISATVEQND